MLQLVNITINNYLYNKLLFIYYMKSKKKINVPNNKLSHKKRRHAMGVTRYQKKRRHAMGVAGYQKKRRRTMCVTLRGT